MPAELASERSLADLIDMQIRANGPISVAAYMALCLTHPSKGYYKKSDPLGVKGDFTTAPEISQMFGELIGFFFVNIWQQLGEPDRFTLLELGPGRGTLMADMLRVASRAPGFLDALHLRLFETNPILIGEQKARLRPFGTQWISSLNELGSGPLLIVANEFFDALPVRQFVKAEDGWHERMVGLKDDRRAFGLSPTPLPENILPGTIRGASVGSVYEVSPAATQISTVLNRAVAERRGAILAIDYGYVGPQAGETLQAVSQHAYADPLESPGEVDLSAHVDFGALMSTAFETGLIAHPVTSQGTFLRALGIAERAHVLRSANPQAASEIDGSLNRLIGDDEMGKLFKVYCATSPGLSPAGFGRD